MSFTGPLKLKSIDISNNQIDSLNRNLFTGIKTLLFLNITVNEISKVDMNTFKFGKIVSIITNSYEICCITIDAICNVLPVWPMSCERLLSDVAARWMTWLISILGVLFNSVSLVYGALSIYSTNI